MKASQLLRLAAERANIGHGVCYALTLAVRDAALSLNVSDAELAFDAGMRIKHHILRLIYGYTFVTDWLVTQGVDRKLMTTEAKHEYRKRWALHMAAEFEAKGD